MTAPERPAEPRTIPEGRRNARERVRAVQQAAEFLPPEGYLRQTRWGAVHVERVEFGKDGEVEWADIYLAGLTEAADPHFRIFNPPTLVEDPTGDIELRGLRFRHDPLAALADTVAQYGGAQAQRKGRRA